MPTLGTKLRELRKKQGLTQVQLSERLGISQSAVCQFEKDVVSPKLSVMKQLAQILNIKIDALLAHKLNQL